MNGRAITAQSLTFTYPDASRRALDAVELSLPDGAFALALGPTGAGKSTFLRCVNGLVPHFTGGTFTGRVRVAGRDTLSEAPRRLADVVAFVPQDPASSFVLDRVEDELAYGMENLGVDATRMRRRVEEMLDNLLNDPMPDVTRQVGKLVGQVYRTTWRLRDDEEKMREVAKLLERTAKELEELRG